MQMQHQFCTDFIYNPLASAGNTLSSWESIKSTSLAVYENMKLAPARLFTLRGNVLKPIVQGMTAWADDFTFRMAVEAERNAYNQTLWRNDALLDDLVATTTRQMCYTFGYTVGYVGEQVLLLKGGAKLVKFIARQGLTYAGTILGRTAFAINSRMHALKRMVQGAAASFELSAAVEKGLAESAVRPLTGTLTKDVTAEVLDRLLRESGFQRNVFNTRDLVEAMHSNPSISALIKTAGKEALFLERTRVIADTIGTGMTAEAAQGFIKAYERMIVLDASGVFVKDNFDEFLRIMLPDNAPINLTRLNTALAQYKTGTGALDLDMTTFMYAMIQDAAKIPSAAEHAAVKLFRDRVEALAPEASSPTLRRYEGVAAARYESKTGETLRRPDAADIPDPSRLVRVDYVDSTTSGVYIDVKGPIMKNEGILETYPVVQSRIDGLGLKAEEKIVENWNLTPPLPTKVIVDLFGLNAAEAAGVKNYVRSLNLDQALFIFIDEL